MRAAALTGYGGPEVIQLKELPIPEIAEDEILVRTVATTVTGVDDIFRSGKRVSARMATGPLKPKIPVLGTELSGIVESVGSKITDFKPGDAVIADSGTNYGAHAEFVKISPKDVIIRKPEKMSFQEAAALSYGGLTALSFLKNTAELQPGQDVLVLGASGSVGSYAVQIAAAMGARVTGVAGTANTEMVKSLGADEVIDYRKTNLMEISEKYDVIFDAVGKYTFGMIKKLLKEGGMFMTTDISLNIFWNMLITGIAGSRKAKISFTGLDPKETKTEGLKYLLDLYDDGKLLPRIDREYDLEDISEAHEYVSSGRKKGNVVINISKGGRNEG